MRAVIVAAKGEPVHKNVRFVSDWAEPMAGAGEAIIRTEASALNHLDLWVGRGLPGIDLQYPRIGGSDACGIVELVGEGVDASWVGRRVIMNAAVPLGQPCRPDAFYTLPELIVIGEHANGGHCEKFAMPVAQLADVGMKCDPVEAAAFGLTFLTAWRCLV